MIPCAPDEPDPECDPRARDLGSAAARFAATQPSMTPNRLEVPDHGERLALRVVQASLRRALRILDRRAASGRYADEHPAYVRAAREIVSDHATEIRERIESLSPHY